MVESIAFRRRPEGAGVCFEEVAALLAILLQPDQRWHSAPSTALRFLPDRCQEKSRLRLGVKPQAAS
jgi:hypothetical protein